MKLWLVCFLILFFGAEAAEWLGHLPWVSSVELSMPLTIAGGIGLAIASNHRHWPSLGAIAAKAETRPLPTTTPATSPTTAPANPPPRDSRKTESISFEIKKPQGKRDGG
ncbi:hypothetical protein C7293_15285 [filamentous cyanobacterium CCT1]|nr:hypothetical protein C7293_15285 [filamentous cyanobacterium CCT1]PSN77066.1 hypothetical protein C8B47_24050 [filamentous cyanobacterium CCP4]